MSKITSPLQALEAICDLCESTPPGMVPSGAYERLHRAVHEAALAGIAYSVPLPAPTRKAARDLVPGDVLVHETGTREVVLYARLIEPTVTSRIELALCALGQFGAAASVFMDAPDSQFTVEAPAGLTPVQAAADRLLGYAKDLLVLQESKGIGGLDDLRTLLDELDPPKPPTLDEALEVIRALTLPATGWSSTADEAARKLLARVPK